MSFLEAYRAHVDERAAQGIPPLPLNAEQVNELVALLKAPPKGEEDALLELLTHRVPPGVDDPGMRQDEPDEPDVRKICRHLVGEEFPRASGMGRGVVQVAAAQARKLLGRQIRHEFGVAHTVGTFRIDGVRQHDDVG